MLPVTPGGDGQPRSEGYGSHFPMATAISTSCCKAGRPAMTDGAGFKVSDGPSGDHSAHEEEKDRLPQREKIIDAVQAARVMFWHDPDGQAYATVPRSTSEPDGALMHLQVRGRKFSLICRRLYGVAHPVAAGTHRTRPGRVSDHALSEANPAFDAIALE